jgi:hypothetical protein
VDWGTIGGAGMVFTLLFEVQAVGRSHSRRSWARQRLRSIASEAGESGWRLRTTLTSGPGVSVAQGGRAEHGSSGCASDAGRPKKGRGGRRAGQGKTGQRAELKGDKGSE